MQNPGVAALQVGSVFAVLIWHVFKKCTHSCEAGVLLGTPVLRTPRAIRSCGACWARSFVTAAVRRGHEAAPQMPLARTTALCSHMVGRWCCRWAAPAHVATSATLCRP